MIATDATAVRRRAWRRTAVATVAVVAVAVTAAGAVAARERADDRRDATAAAAAEADAALRAREQADDLRNTAAAMAAEADAALRAREPADDRRAATAVAAAWLGAWQDGRYDDVNPLTAGADAPADALRRMDERLQTKARRLAPGALSPDGSEVPYTATFTLAGLGELSWTSRVRVTETGDGWRVAFDSPTVHPALGNGQRLERRSRLSRAPLADRDGRPIRLASADLAANVLGRPAGPGGPASGLERVLDERLTGPAEGAVVLADAASGAEIRELQTYQGAPPVPVRTTLDLNVQAAAEQALAGVAGPAALVAVDSATGQVRAVANSPVTDKPRAFTSYAPGSVFKVVTAAALLDNGLTPDSPLDCPTSYRGTRNAASVRPGPTTLAGAFAQSCNTAFLTAAERLPDGALRDAARLFGFGPEPLLPIAVDPGEFPDATGPGDAAAPIGQGRVEATPLLMATALGAVESGTWRQPTLDPTVRPVTRPLPARTVTGLRAVLRAVVENGTGSAADLPGPPVSGKTGSAETGRGQPVHAWFAGYRGGIAFCVFVERGTSGGATAAPIAVRFLRELPAA